MSVESAPPRCVELLLASVDSCLGCTPTSRNCQRNICITQRPATFHRSSSRKCPAPGPRVNMPAGARVCAWVNTLNSAMCGQPVAGRFQQRRSIYRGPPCRRWSIGTVPITGQDVITPPLLIPVNTPARLARSAGRATGPDGARDPARGLAVPPITGPPAAPAAGAGPSRRTGGLGASWSRWRPRPRPGLSGDGTEFGRTGGDIEDDLYGVKDAADGLDIATGEDGALAYRVSDLKSAIEDRQHNGPVAPSPSTRSASGGSSVSAPPAMATTTVSSSSVILARRDRRRRPGGGRHRAPRRRPRPRAR
jgi:hypothetical protein